MPSRVEACTLNAWSGVGWWRRWIQSNSFDALPILCRKVVERHQLFTVFVQTQVLPDRDTLRSYALRGTGQNAFSASAFVSACQPRAGPAPALTLEDFGRQFNTFIVFCIRSSSAAQKPMATSSNRVAPAHSSRATSTSAVPRRQLCVDSRTPSSIDRNRAEFTGGSNS